jgi:hypothetical protein
LFTTVVHAIVRSVGGGGMVAAWLPDDPAKDPAATSSNTSNADQRPLRSRPDMTPPQGADTSKRPSIVTMLATFLDVNMPSRLVLERPPGLCV